LGARAAARVVVAPTLLGAILFGAAGTFRYWEAWLTLGVFFVPMSGALVYFVRHAPDLLERRMKAREERPRQKRIVLLSVPVYLGMLAVPGLDHRFGWSSVPTALVVFSACMMLAGYILLLRVMLENRFASRTIRVEEDQELVTTGSYAVVRHPMYLGVVVMFAFMPLALGSWWALVPALLMPVLLALRILDEEEALVEELPGYPEYMQATRKRLIPGVW
jgi:protein-S-isoprenylcysteine O-methyltransferase Ste14